MADANRYVCERLCLAIYADKGEKSQGVWGILRSQVFFDQYKNSMDRVELLCIYLNGAEAEVSLHSQKWD